MEIIKQIDDDTFIVQLDPMDKLKSDVTHISIAHDYLQIGKNMGMTAKYGLTLSGPNVWCNNWINAYQAVQVPIRDVVEVLIPLLNQHPYCEPKHLLKEDGNPNYNWGESLIFFKNSPEGPQMVAYRAEGETEYVIMTKTTWDKLGKKLKEL